MRISSFLLALGCLAIFCASPGFSFDTGESGWFMIHFQRDADAEVNDSVCLEPEGRYFTSLDSLESETASQKRDDMPFLSWSANLFPDGGKSPPDSGKSSPDEAGKTSADGGVESGRSDSTEGGADDNSEASGKNGAKDGTDLRSIDALLERTGASDVGELQVKIFAVLKGMLCAIVLCLMSGVIVMFSRFFHDGCCEKVRAAIWGYVLSLDLGFLVLGMQGYWSQDRLLSGSLASNGVLPTWSPEIVILMLVGCAWHTFLRAHAMPQRRSGRSIGVNPGS